jgi:hypothetical protein
MRRAGAAAAAGAPGVFTAKDVRAGAAGPGSAKAQSGKAKHATAHLTDEFTRRDLFGVVRGKCNAVRSRGVCVRAGARLRRPARRSFARDAPSSTSPKETPVLMAPHARAAAVRQVRVLCESHRGVHGACPRLNHAARPGSTRTARCCYALTPTHAPPRLRQIAPGSGRPHPDNDLSVTWCTRCRCPPGSHEEAAAATERALGNDAFEAGEHERALLSYTRAITAAPGDAALWSNRAAVFLALRRFPQALHDADRAAQLEPRWAKPRARAAAAHAAMGQARGCGARAHAIRRRPALLRAWVACALLTPPSTCVARALSQHEEACRAFRMALKLDPSSADYAAGVAASQRALDTAAAHHDDPKARGDAAMARREWDAACESYSAALTARPRDGARGSGLHASCLHRQCRYDAKRVLTFACWLRWLCCCSEAAKQPLCCARGRAPL